LFFQGVEAAVHLVQLPPQFTGALPDGFRLLGLLGHPVFPHMLWSAAGACPGIAPGAAAGCCCGTCGAVAGICGGRTGPATWTPFFFSLASSLACAFSCFASSLTSFRFHTGVKA